MGTWCEEAENELLLDPPRPYDRQRMLDCARTRMHENNLSRDLALADIFEKIEAGNYHQAQALLNEMANPRDAAAWALA